MNTLKLSAIIILNMGIAGLHAAQHVLTHDEQENTTKQRDLMALQEYAKNHTEEEVKKFYEDLPDLMGIDLRPIQEVRHKSFEETYGYSLEDSEDEAEDIELPLSDTSVLTNDLTKENGYSDDEDNEKPQQKSFFEKLRTRCAAAKSGLSALSWPTKAVVGTGLAALVVVIMQLIKKK